MIVLFDILSKMKVSEFIEKLEHYNQDYQVVLVIPENIDYTTTNCLDVLINKKEKEVNIIHKD